VRLGFASFAIARAGRGLRSAVCGLVLVLGLAAETGTASAQSGIVRVVAPDGPYTSLPAALAAAAPGDVIEVHAGTYPGPVVIDKSVTVRGLDRPVIDAGDTGTVVTLAAPGIVFSDFTVRGSGVEPDQDHAGITLTAADIVVADNRVEDVLFGIFVAQADRAIVRGNTVTSKAEYDLGRKGDGIRVWYSHDVLVEGNHVYDTRDAVVWYSNGLTFRDNVFDRGRYGVHLMYADDVLIEYNTFEANSVGIYTMYSQGVTIRDNLIRGHHGSSGYALGFKDVDAVEVARNLLIDNSAGVYIDGMPFTPGSPSVFHDNVIAYNDVGVIVMPAVRGNEFRANTFWENVQQMRLEGGGGLADANLWAGNTWSDFDGYDANEDGIGDSPYAPARLFESLVDQEPRLHALRYSPAIDAIEFAASAFPVLKPNPKLVDEAPYLAPLPIQTLPAIQRLPRPASGPATMLLAVGLLALAGLVLWSAADRRAARPAAIPSASLGGPSRGTALAPEEVPMSTPVLTLDGVSKRYGRVQVLQGVSFAAGAGEAIALWGANGAGKTTIIKAMLGLITVDGTVTVLGTDVSRNGQAARRALGYVPQEAVFGDWPVADTLAFFADLKGADRARIPGLLDLVGLRDHVAKPVPALSGGLKQRLALALALLDDPPILLLDEPTANLDSAARRDYLQLLCQLRDAGKTIVFASHRLEEIDHLADRAVALEQGRVIDVLRPEDLRRRVVPDVDLLLWLPADQRAAALDLLAHEGWAARQNGRGTVVVRTATERKLQAIHALSQNGFEVLDAGLE
jgi:nitrous oxidase accessory protein